MDFWDIHSDLLSGSWKKPFPIPNPQHRDMAKAINTSHLLLDDKLTNKSNIVMDSAVLMSGISSLMTVIDFKSACSKMCYHISG